MAKKSRRAARRLSAKQTYDPTTAPNTPTTARPYRSREVNFHEEYPYIISDLQRIGILAAAILSGLVILSFFIR